MKNFNFDVIGTEKEENISLWQVYLTAYKLKTTVTNALCGACHSFKTLAPN